MLSTFLGQGLGCFMNRRRINSIESFNHLASDNHGLTKRFLTDKSIEVALSFFRRCDTGLKPGTNLEGLCTSTKMSGNPSDAK